MRKTKRALALALSAVMLMQPVVNTGALKAYAAGVGIAIEDTDVFPDATFQKYLSEKIDTDKDGALSSSELAVATVSISRTDYGAIEDLTGIEKFTNLKQLDCSGLKLKTLDVTGLTGLTYLDCGDNAIEELNIGKNVNLQTLLCDGNQLKSLSTANNSNLLVLDCSRNTNIQDLSLISSSELKVLRFASTSVSEMEFNTLTELTQLDCSDTALSELDLATNAQLEILLCDRMLSLNSLDISGRNDLKVVSCGGGSLTDVDVSANTGLKVLVCSGKNVWNRGVYKEVETEGESVHVVTPLSTAGSSAIVKLNITGDENLVVLDCSYNKLDALDVSAFKNLEYLDVSSNKLKYDTGLDVSENTALTHYYCSENTFGSVDISNNVGLLKFSCDGVGLMELDLSKNSALKQLSCGNNHLMCLDVSTCDPDITVGCDGNTRTITLDERYEYDFQPIPGFVQAVPNNEKNEDGKARLNKITAGGEINAYKLLPEMDKNQVKYSYFFGNGANAAVFTLNINNPLKVTVIVNRGMEDQRTATQSSGINLLKGDSVMLTAVHSDSYKEGAAEEALNFIQNFTWASGDDKVATVDAATGKLTAVGPGEVKIYGKIGEWRRGYIKLTVDEPVEDIQLDVHELELENGGKNNEYKFSPKILPETATNQDVTYTSSDTKVAKVNANGVVSAMGAGTAKITCTAKDGSEVYDECIVKVIQKVTYIGLPEQLKYMVVGKEETVVPTVSPENAVDKSVMWESDNPSVVTVDEDGVFKALTTGKANVTCKSIDNPTYKASCTVVVLEANAAVKLNKNSCNLVLGGSDPNEVTCQLEITEKDLVLQEVKFTWESADPAVASVNSSGTITARGAGRTVINCKVGSSVLAECEVSVTQLAQGIEITCPVKKLFVGEKVTLTPVFKPETTSNKDVTWTSSDTKIATVDSKGVVTAVSNGEVVITCKSQDAAGREGVISLLVCKPVKDITFEDSSLKVDVGKRVEIGVKVSPKDATDPGIVWTTSDPGVAMVSAGGSVSGISKGTTIITATAKDGSGVTKTITVTVVQPVTSIKLNTNVMVLKKGKSASLKATVAPSNANKKSVKWTTSDKNVVAVTSSGKITAKGAVGSQATITCTAKDGSGRKDTCRVIIGTPITKVKLNKTKATVKKGKTITLKATISPKAPAYPYVTWTSSKEKVATVNNGIVTGVKKGTATITCTASDGSKKKATCKVTVK